jgi:hypothetical protein
MNLLPSGGSPDQIFASLGNSVAQVVSSEQRVLEISKYDAASVVQGGCNENAVAGKGDVKGAVSIPPSCR